MKIFSVVLNEQEMDKLLTHVESMIDISDGNDLVFYTRWYEELTKAINQQTDASWNKTR